MNAQKIILIEDDEILSRMLFLGLSDAGFTVLQAFDGEAGLELVRKERPDLVMLDLVIPKKYGLEVLEALKKHPETETIPVIILTLLSEEKDITKGLQLGANDYLVKSDHTVAEVVERVKSFLAKG